MKANPATRARRDVDRAITSRWGNRYWDHAKFSTDPELSHLLWQDLRARGFCVSLEEFTDCIEGSAWHSKPYVSEYLLLKGTHWTHLDLIARLWLEVAGPLERGAK